jgi:hypothetical protein
MIRFLLIILLIWITPAAAGNMYHCNLTLSSFIIKGKSPVHQFKLVYNQNPEASQQTVRTLLCDDGESHSAIRIPVDRIQGDNVMLTNDFREMVHMDHFPEIILDFDKEQLMSLASGQVQRIAFYLTIEQKKRLISAFVSGIYDKKRNAFHLFGSFLLDLKQFELEIPSKFFGLLKIKDHVDIEFTLIFDRGKNEMMVNSDSFISSGK